MDVDFVSVHKHAKKELGQYPAILTEQTWSIKDLLYGFWGNFACARQRTGSPEGARWLHLARSGSQSQRAIWFILPARGTSHIINRVHCMPARGYEFCLRVFNSRYGVEKGAMVTITTVISSRV